MAAKKKGTPLFPERGVPIDLGDGKNRTLRYTFATRKKIIEEVEGDFIQKINNMDVAVLAQILLYGLQDSDPDLTAVVLDELLDFEILPVVLAAFKKSFGFKDEDPPATTSSVPTATA